jgi:hypothetical protein
MSSLLVYANAPLAHSHVHSQRPIQAPLLRSGRAERRNPTATRVGNFARHTEP